MTLTWAEIDARWPDAGVMWDRDVAPTLDWEPRLRARGDQLWADDPECSQRGHGRCRCFVWWRSQWQTIAHHGAIASLNEDLKRGRLLIRGTPWPGDSGRYHDDSVEALRYAYRHLWFVHGPGTTD